ncbi:hypothetical protein [Streptomyces sp. NPDC059708]
MQHDGQDDFRTRAIPAIPHQRTAQPADDYDTARSFRIPRQPGPDHTDND